MHDLKSFLPTNQKWKNYNYVMADCCIGKTSPLLINVAITFYEIHLQNIYLIDRIICKFTVGCSMLHIRIYVKLDVSFSRLK